MVDNTEGGAHSARISRRGMLKGVAATGLCLTGGIGATGTASATTGGVCSGSARFCDTFSDGDYHDNWTAYLSQGDFDANVITGNNVPQGGQNVVELTETTGGGTDGVLGWKTKRTGWDDEWTVRGLFYSENIGSPAPWTKHELLLYYDGMGDSAPIELQLGFGDKNGNEIPFAFAGSKVRQSSAQTYQPGWQPDTWYHYEAGYDGAGTLSGRLWEAGASRPATPDVTAPIEDSLPDARVAAIDHNGPDSWRINGDFTVHHSFLRWTGPQSGSNNYIENLAGADGDIDASEVQEGIADFNSNARPNPSAATVQKIIARFNS